MNKLQIPPARTTFLLLAGLVGGCAGAKTSATPDESATSGGSATPGESATLASAIRTAIPRAQGYVPVAAGVCEDDPDFYEVAFLDHGKVKRISVDARNGSVERIGDGHVREGSESTADRLQSMLPGAKIDLARAVEIAVGNASGLRAIGVEMDAEDGGLVYLVTLRSGSRAMRTAIDAATGAVLHTEEGAAPGPSTNGATKGATGAAINAATGAAKNAATGAATGAAKNAATDAAKHAATDGATDAPTNAASPEGARSEDGAENESEIETRR